MKTSPIHRCNTPTSAGTESSRRGSGDSPGRRGVLASIVSGGGGTKKSPIKNGAEIFTFNKDSDVRDHSHIVSTIFFWTSSYLQANSKFKWPSL